MRLSVREELRWALTVVAVWTGAGYIFGSPMVYSSSTLAIVRALGVPFPAWGAAYLALAGLLWVAPRAAAFVGVGLYGFWCLCLGATVVTGQIVGWSGPAWALALAVAHHLALRVQREPVSDR